MEAFHGTTQQKAKKITQYNCFVGDPEGNTYITTDLDHAWDYAFKKARELGDIPAVLDVHIIDPESLIQVGLLGIANEYKTQSTNLKPKNYIIGEETQI